MNRLKKKLRRKAKREAKGYKAKPNTNIKGWREIRKEIIKRDDYACRICGDDTDLNVHHIDSCRANNKSTNLVTLCSSCHRAVHFENYKPYEHDDFPAPWGIIE